MAERFPDIEIYIKRATPAQVIDWLSHRLTLLSEGKRGNAVICKLSPGNIDCVIVENAVKGGFTSVWFKSGDTPWKTDRDCALEALEQFGLEIRCNSGSWQEDDTLEGGWIRLTDKGESRINWL